MRQLSLTLMLILTLLLSGCNLEEKYTVSEDGHTIHSFITGIDYNVSTILSTIYSKYTEEEIISYMGDTKESIERLKRYKNGTWTVEDIRDSAHLIVELYIKVK